MNKIKRDRAQVWTLLWNKSRFLACFWPVPTSTSPKNGTFLSVHSLQKIKRWWKKHLPEPFRLHSFQISSCFSSWTFFTVLILDAYVISPQTGIHEPKKQTCKCITLATYLGWLILLWMLKGSIYLNQAQLSDYQLLTLKYSWSLLNANYFIMLANTHFLVSAFITICSMCWINCPVRWIVGDNWIT